MMGKWATPDKISYTQVISACQKGWPARALLIGHLSSAAVMPTGMRVTPDKISYTPATSVCEIVQWQLASGHTSVRVTTNEISYSVVKPTVNM